MKKTVKKLPLVSIIIPLYVINERFFSDLVKYKSLTYPHYEILVVCDKNVELPNIKNVKLILTGEHRTGPAEKRDIAVKVAKGEICAFIDDDAYPDKNWLIHAVNGYMSQDVAAIGGPGLTPPEDEYWEKISGLVYSSYLCGGAAQYRFVKGKKQFVKDYPAYNLFVKTDVLREVGGYGNTFYGGEDTFLCLKLVKKRYKILYDPDVIVYHHKRKLFFGHLKQIANIGKHRGYFAKKYPETSRLFGYFIPSLLTIGFFLLLILSFTSVTILKLFLGLILICIFLGAFSVIQQTTILNAFLVGIGIILTHLSYGLYFIRGLTIKELQR